MEPWMVVALLGVAVLVFARLYGKGGQDGGERSSTDALLKEMEGSLEAYALEVGQENKELLQHVHAWKDDQDKHLAVLQARIERLEKDALAVVHRDRVVAEPSQSPAPMMPNVDLAQADTQIATKTTPVVAPVHVEVEQSNAGGIRLQDRYQQIFDYDRQGKSIDWIARKTGVVKGEVQLILKLAQQEEAGGV